MIVKFLLEQKANPTIANSDGKKPFDFCNESIGALMPQRKKKSSAEGAKECDQCVDKTERKVKVQTKPAKGSLLDKLLATKSILAAEAKE